MAAAPEDEEEFERASPYSDVDDWPSLLALLIPGIGVAVPAYGKRTCVREKERKGLNTQV